LRRLVPAALGALLALSLLPAGLVPALTPATVLAARPDLTIVGEATYDVHPEESRVAVGVKLTATNHLRDTVARRFFFRTGLLTVQPNASGFAITGGSGTPKVSVRSKTATYTTLRIDLGANLAAGKSTTLRLTFDLRDVGGAPDRPLRISPSLVTFTAWAFATPDTPGASVAVRLPTGYSVTVGRGPLTGPEPDSTGFERWTSGILAKPLAFIADVAADRPTDYVETSRTVELAERPATILLRAWPDDPGWRDRIGTLVDEGLPILEREIGLPWAIDGSLAVHEALVRGTGGYAGLFDPTERRIEVAYAAPDIVVLHELAHAWFNGGLVADRWAAEAFASYYADLAATELGLDTELPLPAVIDPTDPAGIPLNEWGTSGTETPATEAYAYAASLELARAVAERAGPDGLREAWAAAARGTGAYGGAAAGPPDWRGLLDLLEETTGKELADLWGEWVARPADASLLAERATAREHYARVAELAGAWQLPASIRDAMRAWRFDVAVPLLATAEATLHQRDALEARAAEAGLSLPSTLRERFEGPDGPEAAAAEAAAEGASVDAILAARAARPTGTGIVERVLVAAGLLLEQPDLQLAAAEAALTAGNVDLALATAQNAERGWSSAEAVGRSRIVSLVLLLVALALFISLLRQARRRRRSDPG
jgi:hypothetical protein